MKFELKKVTSKDIGKSSTDVYHYESGNRKLSFYLHPTRQWTAVLVEYENTPARQRNDLIDAFFEAVIGREEGKSINEAAKFLEV